MHLHVFVMRTSLLLSLVASLVGLSVACSEAPVDKLEQADGTIAGDTSRDEDETEPTTPKPATTTKSETPKPATTTTTTTTTPAPKADATTCDPGTAKTKKECGTCCAQKAPKKVVDSCACGATGKCTTACEQSVCKGGIPDFGCGLCLIQSGCDIGENLDLGDLGTETGACLALCAGKPD